MVKQYDIGCDDFERARRNREIISKKLYTYAYIQVENALKGFPVFEELPYWMPKTDLPFINKTTLIKRIQVEKDMI